MYKKLKEQIAETTQYYMLRNVHPRVEQPFQIRDDERMEQLVEIIRLNGVLNPLIVTTKCGSQEIVSGHRRDAADIVEKIELRHLLVSHDFVIVNNNATESSAVSMTLIISIFTPTVSFQCAANMLNYAYTRHENDEY